MHSFDVRRFFRLCSFWCLLLAAGLLVQACGDGENSKTDAGYDAGDPGDAGDAGDAGGTADSADVDMPVCDPAEFRVRGVLDGVSVDEQLVVAGQMLVNEPGDEGCYLNLYFEGGGRLRLEWADTLPPDQSCAASGSVNLAAQGGINVGDCDDDGAASRITLRADGMEFELRELHEAPYCTAAPVTGTLYGCARFK